MMMDDLEKLAFFIQERNSVDKKISQVIQRPATQGHIGEFIASRIFGISLMPSATNKAIDGYFKSGPLSDRSVDVKFYGKQEGMLDVKQDVQPDYFLVLTGPRSPAISSKGHTRLCVIDYVYLFDGKRLAEETRQRGVKLGVATIVIKQQWEDAEIYPEQRNRTLIVTESQRKILEMFGSSKQT
jgi:hypothetical protein